MKNNIVLVTGSSRGIGREIALAFARAGASVMLHCVQEKEKAVAVQKEIEDLGGRAVVFQADIADQAQVAALVHGIVRQEGRIDVLVNNAAIIEEHLLLRMPAVAWERVLQTDLNGTFYMLQECAKIMMKQHTGAIISIASLAGVRGAFGSANYAAAKAGIIALTKSAAQELGRFKIPVNAVLPGFHLTDMGKTSSPKYIEKVKLDSVLGTTTDMRELSSFIVFLAGMKTVSGQVFNWDSRIIA